MHYGSRKSGKAISPVLATIMLIAITIIAAVALSGFVFGLMGTFTNTALVSSTFVSCTGTPETCILSLYNQGVSNTSLLGSCTLNFGGAIYQGTTHLLSGSLNAGSRASVSCVSNTPGSHAGFGSQVAGSVIVANGAHVLYSGPAQ